MNDAYSAGQFGGIPAVLQRFPVAILLNIAVHHRFDVWTSWQFLSQKLPFSGRFVAPVTARG
ncbi:MAG: hypothetical protein B7Z55_09890 [Planctomycetales bacterium 12-60-4]|nr:MAG: hypothetical protein B7Z55_09890 [Planctomycetales bacterium 12-60-4]